MRNWDSCRCWRCTFCPCKVRNTFLVNFWNCTIHLWTLCILYMCICWLYCVSLYLLYVSAAHVVIFREVKQRVINWKMIQSLKWQNQSKIHIILYLGLVLSLQWLYHLLIFYPLYYLPEDGHLWPTHYGIIVNKNCFTCLHFVGITIVLYISTCS